MVSVAEAVAFAVVVTSVAVLGQYPAPGGSDIPTLYIPAGTFNVKVPFLTGAPIDEYIIGPGPLDDSPVSTYAYPISSDVSVFPSESTNRPLIVALAICKVILFPELVAPSAIVTCNGAWLLIYVVSPP